VNQDESASAEGDNDRSAVGRSDPDTVDLFTFLTLSNFRVSFGIRKEYATRSGPNAER